MSFMNEIEEVEDEVADWAVKVIQEIVDVLRPDGRPYRMQKDSLEKQLTDYTVMVLGGPEAILAVMEEDANFIIKKLEDGGIEANLILTVHPYDLAMRLLLVHSAEMEDELRKRASNE